MGTTLPEGLGAGCCANNFPPTLVSLLLQVSSKQTPVTYLGLCPPITLASAAMPDSSCSLAAASQRCSRFRIASLPTARPPLPPLLPPYLEPLARRMIFDLS